MSLGLSSMEEQEDLQQVARELRWEFLNLAKTLDDYYDLAVKARVVGTAASVLGGSAVVVAGIAATVTTMGLASPVVLGGAALASAGSLASGGASLLHYVLERHNLSRTEEKWRAFKLKYFDMEQLSAEEGMTSFRGQTAMASSRPDDFETSPMVLTEQDLRQSVLSEVVYNFLEFCLVFLMKSKWKNIIRPNLIRPNLTSFSRDVLKVEAEEKSSQTLQRLGEECGVSVNEIQQIEEMLGQFLPQLNRTHLHKFLEEYTTDDFVEAAASLLASHCSLSPQLVVKLFLFISSNMTDEEKRNVFGSLAVRGEATATRISSTVLQAAKGGLSKAAGWTQQVPESAVSSGLATRLARSAASYLPASLTNAGSAALQTTRTGSGLLASKAASAVATYVPAPITRAGAAALQAARSTTGAIASKSGQAVFSMANKGWVKNIAPAWITGQGASAGNRAASTSLASGKPQGMLSFRGQIAMASRRPDEFQTTAMVLTEQDLRQSMLFEGVYNFLEFCLVFINKSKRESVIRQNLTNFSRKVLKVEAEEKASQTLQRLGEACGVSVNDIQHIVEVLDQYLPQLNLTHLHKFLEEYTTDNLVEAAASLLASHCSLSPQPVVKLFLFISSNMTYEEKRNVFGSLAVTGAATATRITSTVLQAAKGGLSKAAGWTQQVPESAVSSGLATRLARSAASYLPASLTNAGSAALQTTRTGSGLLASKAASAVATYVPAPITRAGAAALQAARSTTGAIASKSGQAVSSLANKGWVKNIAPAWITGQGASAGSRAAASTSLASGKTLASTLSKSAVILNVALLPLSVRDLVQASAELRDKNTSRAGDYLRHLANLLPSGNETDLPLSPTCAPRFR